MSELSPPTAANPLVDISAVQRNIAAAIAKGDADALMSLRSVCHGAAQMLATRGHKLVKANEYAKGAIDCEAALGEMLAQTVFDKGGGDHRSPRATSAPSLREIGVNKSQSSRWQLIAANIEILPAAVEALVAKDGQITTKGVVREIKRLLAGEDVPAPLAVPEGEFSVIVIDPPWDMKKIERDVRDMQVAITRRCQSMT